MLILLVLVLGNVFLSIYLIRSVVIIRRAMGADDFDDFLEQLNLFVELTKIETNNSEDNTVEFIKELNEFIRERRA